MIGVDEAAGLGRNSRQGNMGKAEGAGLSTSIEEWESGWVRLVTVPDDAYCWDGWQDSTIAR